MIKKPQEMPPAKTEGVKTQQCASHLTSSGPKSASSSPATLPARSSGRVTRVTVKYDVGFSNAVYIRGVGPGLSWNKGVKMVNRKADEWVWETDQPIERSEFKVLVNDVHYEKYDNHKLTSGADVVYTPTF